MHNLPTVVLRLRHVLVSLVVFSIPAVLLVSVATPAVAHALGVTTLIVRGGSMGAAIPTGSLALGTYIPRAQIQPGDVILMAHAHGPGEQVGVLHRVVDVQESDGERIVHTKGDANADPDAEPFQLPEQVLRTTAHLPYAGYLVALMALPVGKMLLAVTIIAFVLRQLVRARSETRLRRSPLVADV